jgi:REP element-mobilizing transposase RayT
MARALRPEVAGGIHHVYARACDGRDLFIDDAGRRRYLALLAQTVRRHKWRCLAYCLMTNHVHLLVETPAPDLGAGMQHLHGAYARYFNQRRARNGPVFQGRYGSTLVTSDEQLVTVIGYVVHNPVKAGLVGDPGGWPWSSHAAMVGRAERPPWLDADRLLELLRAWGGDPRATYGETVGARGGAGGPGVTVSTSLVNVGGGGPPSAPTASVVRKR